MDLITYPSMDAFPFQQQQQQLFDSLDDTFEMEQLLAAAFDSSSSSELFQCSNEDDICFDPFYSASEFFVDDKNDVFLAEDDSLLVPHNLLVSPYEQFHQPDNEFYHSNKRQKINHNDYDSSSLFMDMVQPPPQLVVTPPPQPLPFSTPPVFSYGISNTNNNNCVITGRKSEMEGDSRSLSAQSLSARQRRRKISEKTKELGKLVPGGQRMNTAEMFEAASSYIKFLQAQFAILQLMESPSSSSSSSSLSPVHDEEDLQCLVGSPLVQEKLYMKQKCIAPKGLVESLENNNDIQSNSQTLKDVRNLILTMC